MINCWFCQEEIDGVPEFHCVFRCHRFYCFNEKNRNYGIRVMTSQLNDPGRQLGSERIDQS